MLRASDELLRRHILEEPRSGVYRFVHNQLRDGVYNALEPERLVALHALIAQTLEGNEGVEPLELGEHFLRGELWAPASRIPSMRRCTSRPSMS